MEYILQLSKLTMVFKIIKREEPAEVRFTVRYIENEDGRRQLAKIFHEAGMKRVEAEPFDKNLVELIALDNESKKVVGGGSA